MPTIDYNVAVDSYIGSQRIDYEYSSQLVYARESAAPFTAFLTKMATEKSLTSVRYWFDVEPMPDTDTVVTGWLADVAANTEQNLVVADTSIYRPKQIIEFPNSTPSATHSNLAIVMSITNSTTLVIKGHDPQLGLKAVAASSPINILGSSYEQGSSGGTPVSVRPTRYSNTSQILIDEYSVTKSYENERFFGAPERARLRAETEIRHLLDVNKTLLMGKSITGTTASPKVYDTTYQTNARSMTKGFEQFVDSGNVFSYTDDAGFTASFLFDAMTAIHQNAYGAEGNMDRRLVFGSSQALSLINKLQLSNIRFNDIPTSWGVNIRQLVWGVWTWDLVHDPTLTKHRPGWMYIMQPRYIKYVPFRTTTFRANVQSPRDDKVIDQFLTEPNLEVRLSKVHGIIKP